jgi:hypothetical protein
MLRMQRLPIIIITTHENAARAANVAAKYTKTSSCQQLYDPLVIAELVAFLKFNNSPCPHKLSA